MSDRKRDKVSKSSYMRNARKQRMIENQFLQEVEKAQESGERQRQSERRKRRTMWDDDEDWRRVDAALDDANIALFNQFVKDISERSQIVLVTHNKRTMEVSDNLFGVSMEKKGISTLVSVNLNQIAA